MIRKYAEIFCWKNGSSFCSAKATPIFSAKNIRILYIESAKAVNEMTLNELVKLTMLWTTGPRYPWCLQLWCVCITRASELWLAAPFSGNLIMITREGRRREKDGPSLNNAYTKQSYYRWTCWIGIIGMINSINELRMQVFPWTFSSTDILRIHTCICKSWVWQCYKLFSVLNKHWNHLCLASYKRDIGKQCRPRSDERSAASDQGLHCLH